MCIGTRAQYEMTALLWATYNGHADCVQLLMEVGADKEARDKVRGWFQLPRLRMSQCFFGSLVMVSADICIFEVSMQLLLSDFLCCRVNLLLCGFVGKLKFSLSFSSIPAMKFSLLTMMLSVYLIDNYFWISSWSRSSQPEDSVK